MSEEIKKTPEVETLNTSNEVEKTEEKLLTQEQVDKVIAERLDREKKKLLKEKELEINEVKAEAERLAKLSAEEKEKELTAKQNEEIKEREKGIAIRENRLDAIELFTEAKVPTELVAYVIDESKDKTLENTETFIKTFSSCVAKGVAEQLKGTPPKDISVNSNDNQVKKIIKSF